MRRLIVVMFAFICVPFSVRAASIVPNDPFYNDQWYMKKIGMEQAWGMSHESSSTPVIVAVIDTRIDLNHEDLAGAIWTNTKEIPGNGIDDDGNGYIDDIHGWNFIDRSNDVNIKMTSGTSLDAYVHGTIVSSLIAARGNNGEGIAGMDWHAKIMPIVGLDEAGNGMTDRVSDAVNYAVKNGASIINMSIEGDTQDPALDEAIMNARLKGVLTIVAAGNSSVDGGRNLDTDPVYPTCSSSDPKVNLIAVAATNRSDQRASFSDYGRCVSISAPGEDIIGAEPDSTYSDGWNGTSLAAPLVSGAAALLKGEHPLWTPAQIKDRLLKTATSIDALQGSQYQGKLGAGRLNVAAALAGSEMLSSFEVQATNPGTPTVVSIISNHGMNEVYPFGSEDARGAHAAIGDMNGDGQAEIAIVPAAGSHADLLIVKSNGDEVARMSLPGSFVNGGLVTAVDGGFVVADADGGAAWGIDAQLNIRMFYPYEAQYRNGVDLLTIQHEAAFAPRNGGGRLVISDVHGTQLVSAFPFGTEADGRWSLARMDANDGSYIVFSGPAGSKRIGVNVIGQLGWEPVSFEALSASKITLSSGLRTQDPMTQSYGTWNE